MNHAEAVWRQYIDNVRGALDLARRALDFSVRARAISPHLQRTVADLEMALKLSTDGFAAARREFVAVWEEAGGHVAYSIVVRATAYPGSNDWAVDIDGEAMPSAYCDLPSAPLSDQLRELARDSCSWPPWRACMMSFSWREVKSHV